MTALTQGFYDRLSGNAPLTSILGSYDGAPSIFTKRPLPPAVTLEDHGPYIITTGQIAEVPGEADTKNATGREIVRDIQCFQDIAGDPGVIEQVAERVRDLFHRTPPTVSGYTVTIAEVTGPVEADEDGALGRVVTVRLVMDKN